MFVTRTASQFEVGVIGWRRAKSSFFADPRRALQFATEMARISSSNLLVNLGGADA
jgi:hypothetical protein